MQGKKLSVRWLRVAAVIAAVPIFWVVVGVPVVGFVWMSLVVLAALILLGLRLGWGTTTRSIDEIIHDLDAESAIPVHATSAGPAHLEDGGRR